MPPSDEAAFVQSLQPLRTAIRLHCYRMLGSAVDADDAVQGMPDGIFEGRAAIRARLANELDAIPDVTHTVVSFIEQGDAFADEWTFVGTQTGALTLPDGSVLPPTGKRVEVRGMEVVRVGQDGKIVLNTLYFDNLAVAAQLGVVQDGPNSGVGHDE